MRRLPSLRLIWFGPSALWMRATEDRGTVTPVEDTIGKAASAAGSLRAASGRRTTTSKRRSPSKMRPASAPPMAADTASETSAADRP